MIKKAPTAKPLLPTLVCAWCKAVMRRGAIKVSHGICKPCAAQCFGKVRQSRSRLAA